MVVGIKVRLDFIAQRQNNINKTQLSPFIMHVMHATYSRTDVTHFLVHFFFVTSSRMFYGRMIGFVFVFYFC